MTFDQVCAIREAADYLRQQSFTARERWTKAEAARLAEQLEAVLADVAAAMLARRQP